MEKGDIVLVDVGFENGGYEAEIVGIGKNGVVARIKADGQEWHIMASRLTPKPSECKILKLKQSSVIKSLPNIQCALCDYKTDSQIKLLHHHHVYHS